ncbi:MAG TPA: SDR family oxidoreductase [Anaerolineales bacterium]|nr:SDR family oxidoreductase [Anaerolineales bacterium]
MASLKGKTILVTGGTSGIGLVTARELARMGGQVTILSRSAEKCAAVAEAIKVETGNPVEFIAADLSTLAGIMQAAAAFKQRHTHLHILVNNAGAMFTHRQVTVDGYEMTFALNHLNYFLLTMLLLDLLKASAPARIVNVSSHAHEGARLDFDNLQSEKHFSSMQAYGQSKLANVLFTYELARRLAGSGVTANALHPGFIATGFARNNGPLYNFGMKVVGLFIRKPEEGARTSIYLASSPEVEGVTGKYFVDSQAVDSSPLSYDKELAEKLWQASLELTGKAI